MSSSNRSTPLKHLLVRLRQLFIKSYRFMRDACLTFTMVDASAYGPLTRYRRPLCLCQVAAITTQRPIP